MDLFSSVPSLSRSAASPLKHATNLSPFPFAGRAALSQLFPGVCAVMFFQSCASVRRPFWRRRVQQGMERVQWRCLSNVSQVLWKNKKQKTNARVDVGNQGWDGVHQGNVGGADAVLCFTVKRECVKGVKPQFSDSTVCMLTAWWKKTRQTLTKST